MDDFEEIISKIPDPYEGLYFSIDTGDESLVLSELAKIREQNLESAPALSHCINRRELEILILLLREGVRPDESVVEAAAWNGDPTVLAPLLDNGWPINQPLRNGVIPSLLCFAVNNEELLAWLLKRSADPNALSTTAETPLSVAVREGSVQAVHMLLKAGGDVNRGNLLHRAVEREPSDATTELIDLLISRGARVDAIEFEAPQARQLRHAFPRGTALHKACFMGNVLAAEALLKHDASPSHARVSRRQENLTPFETAKAKGNEAIIALLLEHQPSKLE